jgi:DNA-binding MarR family transcriptional regulator
MGRARCMIHRHGAQTIDEPDSLIALENEFALLVRRLESESRNHPLPLQRAHYLLLLELANGPLSVGALAGRLGLDSSTVTRQLLVMHGSDLVAKTANPADARGAIVERTAKGAAMTQAHQQQRRDRIGRRFESWSEAERQQLAYWLKRLNDQLGADG